MKVFSGVAIILGILFLGLLVIPRYSPVMALSNGQTCSVCADGTYCDSQCTAGACTHGSGPAKYAGCYSNYAGKTATVPYCRTLCGSTCFGRFCCGDTVCNSSFENESCTSSNWCTTDCGPKWTCKPTATKAPTATPKPATATPKPPTATPKPATATPKPPTATPKPATATPKPATSTPIPPTGTNYSISGRIFIDYNGDCVMNGADTWIVNDNDYISLWLRKSDGTTVGSLVSNDLNGNYRLPATGGVASGSYYIEDNGYDGKNGPISSACFNMSGERYSFTLGPNHVHNIGFHPADTKFNITGTVFVDTNENGVKDTGESVFPGASVQLSTSPLSSRTTNTSGFYAFNDINTGVYTVTLVMPSGYRRTTTNPVTVSLSQDTTVNFGIVSTDTPTITLTPTPDTCPPNTVCNCTFRVFGLVRNSSTLLPVGDVDISIVKSGETTQTTTTNSLGAYNKQWTHECEDSTYLVRFSKPTCDVQSSSVVLSQANSYTARADKLLTCDDTITLTPEPPTGFDVEVHGENLAATPGKPASGGVPGTGGLVFDEDGDGQCTAADTQNYNKSTQGNVTITLSDGAGNSYNGVVRDNGNYWVGGRVQTKATVLNIIFANSSYRVVGLRSGLGFTIPYPISGYGITFNPPIFTSARYDICVSGANTWFQTTTGDVRFSRLVNGVPDGQHSSSVLNRNSSLFSSTSQRGQYGNEMLNDPGVISYKANEEYLFEKKSAESRGSASYDIYLSRIRSAGVQLIDLPGPGGGLCDSTSLANCRLDIPGLPNSGRVYHANSAMVLNDFQMQSIANQRILILVNDDLTINTNIVVPANTVVIFAVKGSITVAPTVQNIQGIFTAQQNIEIPKRSSFSCPSNPDTQLVVDGNLIANAVQPFHYTGNGRLILERSLCTANNTTPTLKVNQRLDFILQLTDFYKNASSRWAEVEP